MQDIKKVGTGVSYEGEGRGVHGYAYLFYMKDSDLETLIYTVIDGVRGCCSMPNIFFPSYIMVRTSYIWWNDDVHFALGHQAELGFYSNSSLKQQFEDRHVAALGHIILIPNQPAFVRTP